MRLRNLVSAADLSAVQHPKSFAAVCSASEAQGDWVHITGPSVGGMFSVGKVDISDVATMPAVGVITQKTSTTQCLVQWSGEVVGVYTGLSYNSLYFVGVDSLAVTPPPTPTTAPLYWQVVGVALDSDVLLVSPHFQFTRKIP